MRERSDLPVRRRSPNVLEVVIITALFLLALIWFGGAFGNRDPLWFVQAFDERPSAIRMYHYGAVRDVLPGQPGYDELVSAINAEVARHAGYYDTLAPAGDSLASYQARGLAVEMLYARPVQVHTRFFFPAASRLLIAIDGSYNYLKVPFLFRGSADQWLPGGLALGSVDRVRAAIAALAGNP